MKAAVQKRDVLAPLLLCRIAQPFVTLHRAASPAGMLLQVL
jgi:hypothetical protein